jgi:uncharacterized membrane protein
MNLIRQWWQDEPARFWAALVIFVNAVIAFVVSMGWLEMTGEQVALLYLVVLGGATLIGGESVRAKVTPNGKEPSE